MVIIVRPSCSARWRDKVSGNMSFRYFFNPVSRGGSRGPPGSGQWLIHSQIHVLRVRKSSKIGFRSTVALQQTDRQTQTFLSFDPPYSQENRGLFRKDAWIKNISARPFSNGHPWLYSRKPCFPETRLPLVLGSRIRVPRIEWLLAESKISKVCLLAVDVLLNRLLTHSIIYSVRSSFKARKGLKCSAKSD